MRSPASSLRMASSTPSIGPAGNSRGMSATCVVSAGTAGHRSSPTGSVAVVAGAAVLGGVLVVEVGSLVAAVGAAVVLDAVVGVEFVESGGSAAGGVAGVDDVVAVGSGLGEVAGAGTVVSLDVSSLPPHPPARIARAAVRTVAGCAWRWNVRMMTSRSGVRSSPRAFPHAWQNKHPRPASLPLRAPARVGPTDLRAPPAVQGSPATPSTPADPECRAPCRSCHLKFLDFRGSVHGPEPPVRPTRLDRTPMRNCPAPMRRAHTTSSGVVAGQRLPQAPRSTMMGTNWIAAS